MVAISKVLLFATSVCASVLPRQASTIQTDLNNINSGVTDLKNSVNSYNGGLFAALPIQSKASDLQKEIDSATDDANASPAIGESDSASIVAYIQNTLEPNIDSTLDALVAKKSQFASAGLTNTVKTTVSNLQTSTNNYGMALLAKAASGSQSAGQAVLAKINVSTDILNI